MREMPRQSVFVKLKFSVVALRSKITFPSRPYTNSSRLPDDIAVNAREFNLVCHFDNNCRRVFIFRKTDGKFFVFETPILNTHSFLIFTLKTALLSNARTPIIDMNYILQCTLHTKSRGIATFKRGGNGVKR